VRSSQRRDPPAIQELPDARGEDAARCTHCGRNSADHEMAMEALRTRIRVLEAAWALEMRLAAKA